MGKAFIGLDERDLFIDHGEWYILIRQRDILIAFDDQSGACGNRIDLLPRDHNNEQQPDGTLQPNLYDIRIRCSNDQYGVDALIYGDIFARMFSTAIDLAKKLALEFRGRPYTHVDFRTSPLFAHALFAKQATVKA